MTLTLTDRPLDQLVPFASNARLHSDGQVAQIAASIREFGFNNPVLVAPDGTIIAGHGRVMAARKLGLLTVPVIELPHLSEAQRRAYVIADNRLAETGGGWDLDLLRGELEDLAGLGFDVSLTGFDRDAVDELAGEGKADPYTRKVESPKYEPKGEKPDVDRLFDATKTRGMVERINRASIPEDIKVFLLAAAHRHTVFNFEQIAEFYSHSDRGTQRLMEESALVIIDFGKAIELGFVAFADEIRDAFKRDNPHDEA